MFAVNELLSECSFMVGHGVVMHTMPLFVTFANTPPATVLDSASHASVTMKRATPAFVANRPRTSAASPVRPDASINFAWLPTVSATSDQSSDGAKQLAFAAPFAHTVVLRLSRASV